MIRAKDILFAWKPQSSQKQGLVEKDPFILLKSKAKPIDSTSARQGSTTRNSEMPFETCRSKDVHYPRRKLLFFKRSLFLGQQPTRLVVGFVDNNAYNGNIVKSPFNFMNYNINFVCICRNGTQIPSSPLQPNVANNNFIRSYLRLFSQTSQYFADTGLALSRSDFGSGYTLFAFDLTPQINLSDPTSELIKCGNIILEVHFAAATPRTLTAVVLAEHDIL